MAPRVPTLPAARGPLGLVLLAVLLAGSGRAEKPVFGLSSARPWSAAAAAGLAMDGEGRVLQVERSGGGWVARESSVAGRVDEPSRGEGAARVFPLARGFLIAETDPTGLWRTLRRVSSEARSIEFPPPAPGLRAPVFASEGDTWFAAAADTGVRWWRSDDAGGSWREGARPALSAGATPVALVARRDGVFMLAEAGGLRPLLRHAGGAWTMIPVPADFPADGGMELFSSGAEHLAFAEHGGTRVRLWHPVTRAWVAHEFPPGVAAAGAAFAGGRSALAVTKGEGAALTLGVLAVETRRPHFGAANYGALAAYLAGMMVLGVYFMRRVRDARGYHLAGGRIPWWAAGISVYATTLSSITVLAMPAKSFATDWTFLLAPLTILLLVPVIIRFYLPFFRRLRVASAYEYLERRFSYSLRAYASVAFVSFQLGRVAIVTYLPSLALATVCGLDLTVCVLLIGVLCTVYTVLGGIEGSIWTSVLQAGVMLGSALACLLAVLQGAGGDPVALAAEAWADGKLRLVDFSWSLAQATTWIIVAGNLVNNLVPYTSDQSVIQRYLTTTDEAQARRAIWLNGFLSFPSAALFFALGTGLYLFFKHHPAALHPDIAGESILPFFIAGHLPAGFAGLVVAGIFAAAQSNVSSDLNSGATALVTDFVERFRPGMPERARLNWARGATAALGVVTTGVALALTRLEIRSFLDAYISLVGLMGTGLAAVFALGIFTVRVNAAGAFAGVAVSAAALGWLQGSGLVHFFWYGLTGFSTCVATALLVSAVTGGGRPGLEGLTIWTTPVRERGGAGR